MITKTIIGVLLCSLVAIVGLFLYSDYQLQTKTVAVDSQQKNNTAETAATSNNIASSTTKSADTEIPSSQSVDKPLPIPAQ